MTEPQNMSGLMDQIHDLKQQLAETEKRGAVKALLMAADEEMARNGSTLALERVLRLARRIASGEVTLP